VAINDGGTVSGAGGAGPSVDRAISTPIGYHGTGLQLVWPSSHIPVRATTLALQISGANFNPGFTVQSVVFPGWIRGRVVAREATALGTFPVTESNRFRCTWFCKLSRAEEGTASVDASTASTAGGGQIHHQTLSRGEGHGFLHVCP